MPVSISGSGYALQDLGNENANYDSYDDKTRELHMENGPKSTLNMMEAIGN